MSNQNIQPNEPHVKTKIARKYTDDQIGLIKATFNEHTLMVIRKYLLQAKLNNDEKNIVKQFSEKKEAVNFLREAFLPQIDTDMPIDNLFDSFSSVNLSNNVEYMNYDMEARQISIDYFNELLNLMELKEFDANYKIKIAELAYNRKNKPEKNYINILARHIYIIQHIEFQLKQILYFYELEEETEEQIKEREQKDSVE